MVTNELEALRIGGNLMGVGMTLGIISGWLPLAILVAAVVGPWLRKNEQRYPEPRR